MTLLLVHVNAHHTLSLSRKQERFKLKAVTLLSQCSEVLPADGFHQAKEQWELAPMVDSSCHCSCLGCIAWLHAGFVLVQEPFRVNFFCQNKYTGTIPSINVLSQFKATLLQCNLGSSSAQA